MKVKTAALLNKVETRSDRSIKLVFETRELSGTDMAVLFSLAHSEGWLLFAPNDLNETDVPDEKADSMTNQKTQAQRIRATIFKLWEQKGKAGNFEDYYRSKTEQIITSLKERLE